MEPRVLKPNARYLGKTMLVISLVALLIIAFFGTLGVIISLDDGPGLVFGGIFVSLGVLFWIVGMALAGPYYRSLRYEIHDDEIIVHVGVITKSVKHVPYRTVTNIKVNRGLLDRFVFNIGSLNIQTAGMSGNTGAEESLVGLEDVQEIYELVATKLRRYRGAMGPTGADDEGPSANSVGSLAALLDEVRAIRRGLEERRP